MSLEFISIPGNANQAIEWPHGRQVGGNNGLASGQILVKLQGGAFYVEWIIGCVGQKANIE